MPLGGADYLIGCLTSIAVLVALGWGSVRLRRRIVPEWDGALARTAEATVVVAALATTAQLLAAAHLLRPLPTLASMLVVGVAMSALGSPGTTPGRSAPAGSGRPSLVVAAVAGAAVVGQWAAHTVVAFDGGMTQLDTLYYHAPYSARFLQDGTMGHLLGVGTSGSRVYPLVSELLHALVAMPFGADLVSPLVSLVFLGIIVVAAWAVGQPHGMGAISVLGALVVVSFPGFVTTQAAQASSDVIAAAFLVAAVAMLLAGDLRPAPTALAGVAAGLALGAKLSVVAPVATLTVGLIIVGAWRHRTAVAGWCLGLAALMGGWFIRNWLLVDNPLPWFALHVGPVSLRASAVEDAPPLVDSITDLTMWRSKYLPAVPASLGLAWPVVLVVLLGGAITLLVRRRGILRVAAASVLVGVAAHPLMPQTGGIVFGNNLRFLYPVLMLAGTLLALLAATASSRVRTVLAGGLGVLVLVNLLSPHETRVPMWPGGAAPIAAAVVGAGLVLATAVGAARWGDRVAAPPARPWVRLAALAVVVVILTAGWPVQQHYGKTRYVTTALARVDLYAPFHDVHDERVAVLGEPEVYPMFGSDLSNQVTHLTNKDRREDIATCLAWRQALVDRFDYVAVLPFFITPMDMDPDELRSDPAATVVARSDLGTVYRIDGRIATDTCAADQRP